MMKTTKKNSKRFFRQITATTTLKVTFAIQNLGRIFDDAFWDF